MNQKKIEEARKLLCAHLGELAKEQGLTHQQIADATGFQRNSVTRMLSGRFPPTLDSFLKLCDAIGVYIFVEPKDADTEMATLMRNRHKRV